MCFEYRMNIQRVVKYSSDIRYSFNIQNSPMCKRNSETNVRRISNRPLDIHSIFKTHPKSLFDIHLIFKTALCAKETRKRMSDEYQTARWIFIRYSKHTQNLYSIFISYSKQPYVQKKIGNECPTNIKQPVG